MNWRGLGRIHPDTPTHHRPVGRSPAMPDRQEIGLSTIGQIAVQVQDLDRAVAFYRERLRLPFLFQAPPGLAFFAAGGVRLMLSRPEGEGGGTSGLYFRGGEIQGAS